MIVHWIYHVNMRFGFVKLFHWKEISKILQQIVLQLTNSLFFPLFCNIRLIVAPVLEKESPKAMFPRKFFEEEYLNLEAQVTVHFLTSMSKELVSLPMFQLHVWYRTCFASGLMLSRFLFLSAY